MDVQPAPGPGVTDRLAQVEEALKAVPDPEIPVITIHQLGVIREVERVGEGLRVTITPTYSGCPAMRVMEEDIRRVCERADVPVEVVTRLSPAWTTDWMSEEGREALRRFGIAPPTGQKAHGPVPVGLSVRQVTCPLCGSGQTEEISRFGSTACKALRRCLSCREPFDEFKTL